MKNVKTLLLATLVSFMMVTSTMANPISNDADLIFSNSATQEQSVDFSQLSTTEMQETEGAFGNQRGNQRGQYHLILLSRLNFFDFLSPSLNQVILTPLIFPLI